MALQKRLTPKTFNKDIKGTMAKSETDEVFIAAVWGVAKTFEVVENNYGTSTKFVGEFHGVGADGEEHISGNLYVPGVIEALLANAVGDTDGEVEFAYELWVRAADNPVGYEYDCRPLTEPKESDRMQAMRKKVESKVKKYLPSK